MVKHRVKLGDCMESIAYQYGFTCQSLWSLTDNAQLKKLRKNPNLLFPGDIVVIPPLEIRQIEVSMNSQHLFKRKGLPNKINIQLLDNGTPFKNEDYKLLVDEQMFSGTTDVNGEIKLSVPLNATQGHLTLIDSGRKFNLEIGSLGPINELTGFQARLKNLGYYMGEIDGLMNDCIVDAISLFQKDNDLPCTGEPDEQTAIKLQSTHGI